MADLFLRNLTATQLELKVVERFEGRPTQGTVTSKLSGMFNGSSASDVSPNVEPEGECRDRREVSFPVGRFESAQTDVRAADPGREVLRLTFESDGHRYQVDVPSATSRSAVMRKLDGGPHEYTAVYVQAGAALAVYSSANLCSWMRELGDQWPLSALSIPGTHNSPTCHIALPSVRCQAAGVREQLDNGVRAFDIRVSVSPDGSDLVLVHSAFPISLTGNKYFHDLLSDVYAFLDANSSETLIMSIKREGTGKGSDWQLSRYVKERYAAGDDERRWYTEPRIPRLGEARGKVVLLRRYANDESLNGEHGGAGYGLDCSSWPDNVGDAEVGSGVARIQDFYEVEESKNIQKKIDLARAHLEHAAERVCGAAPGDHRDDEYRPLFINFLSANNFFSPNCWPENIAAKVNPAIIEYLSIRHGESGKGPNGLPAGDACTGVVMTDWCGQNGNWDLIRCIVGWNGKLQLK